MRTLSIACLVALLGCTPKDDAAGDSAPSTDDTATATDDTGSTADDTAVASDDTGSADDTGDTDPPTLYGQAPAVALPAPEFAALTQYDQPRSQPDLIGHPTVLWFYPLANTYG